MQSHRSRQTGTINKSANGGSTSNGSQRTNNSLQPQTNQFRTLKSDIRAIMPPASSSVVVVKRRSSSSSSTDSTTFSVSDQSEKKSVGFERKSKICLIPTLDELTEDEHNRLYLTEQDMRRIQDDILQSITASMRIDANKQEANQAQHQPCLQAWRPFVTAQMFRPDSPRPKDKRSSTRSSMSKTGNGTFKTPTPTTTTYSSSFSPTLRPSIRPKPSETPWQGPPKMLSLSGRPKTKGRSKTTTNRQQEQQQQEEEAT